MKKLLPILLLTSLLLSACSIHWNNEKDTKIAELEKQVQDDTFQKKQNCLGYADKMLSFAQKYRSSIYELEEIFYSPVEESCILIGKDGIVDRLALDYLNQKFIAEFSYEECMEIQEKNLQVSCLNEQNEHKDQFYNLIKELKGE